MSTAFTLPSGAHAIVIPPPRQPRASQPEPAAAPPLTTPWWLSAGAIVGSGVAGIVAAVLLGVIYVLAYTAGPDNSPGRVALLAVAMAVLIAGMMAVIVGWAVRVVGRRQRIAQAEVLAKVDAIAETVAAGETKLDCLPEVMGQLRARINDAVGTVMIEAALLRDAVGTRLDELERRVEAAEARGILPAQGNGHTSGLDAEVIELARRISDRISEAS